MSGFEIFGVVAAAGPILQSTIPTIVRTVETLRDSKVIKAKTAADVTTLSHELQLWHQIYVRILKKRSPNMGRDAQLVTEFGSLFEDFPIVVSRITEESKRTTEKSTLSFLVHRSKLEGMRDSQSEADVSIQDELTDEVEYIDGSECYVAQLKLHKIRLLNRAHIIGLRRS
ncbi:hypothetical protein FRC10_006321 [Ceratobasidium sp. 414]|nr:hypothetical protein FRC10_006321 [Ceratobasidium sp. 414]